MSDENVKKYEKTKETVNGMINGLRRKAAFYQMGGAAIVMGFEKSQLEIEQVGLADVIAINEEDGAQFDEVDAVVDYCNSCLRAIRAGADHFEVGRYNDFLSAGCAVLDIKDENMMFLVAVVSRANFVIADRVIHFGNYFCPFKVWDNSASRCTQCEYD